ncbi:hypothetical protein AJ80_08934 [Polytolypa hystricis UAMH7299]|uniref:C2H2-type domain-containing protein n=1 Tax=Polytolypa hystricis (strain UAMH7299) TaxID=1447883 RepID=A0A2B7WZN8_POLH7|nr:hypothetical protein AJ80_08934 [Polytolypa hystricis UAMH7299]
MTMVIEHQNRQYGGIGYDSVYHHNHAAPSAPHFNENWASQHSSSYPSSSVYSTPVTNAGVTMNAHIKRDDIRPPAISLPYSNIPVSAPTMVAGNNYTATTYGGPEMLVLPPDLPRTSFEQPQTYTSASPMSSTFSHTSYSPIEYVQSLHQQQQQQQQSSARSMSQSNESPVSQAPPSQPQSSATFGDALDASRGMVALSQDMTPRNIYAPRNSRGSTDSYGFPSAHSSASSISSASNYPFYSASVVSADSSVTDYSSTSESYEAHASRTLPRPTGLMPPGIPGGPQSMMGQFSSKQPSNTLKKHKCKVCDKRFTRPSSLTTHMYSHTGEKPHACDFEGCGRHFSVVSNLRRHKKVHKTDKVSVSPEAEE